ncbi:MAG: DUF3368 domain-containing protein [Bacteroidota bacterium]
MIVVSDTSPLSALFKVNLLNLLPTLFGTIIIPPAVRDELLYLNKQGFNVTPLLEANWLEIQEATDTRLMNRLSLELDVGEVASICLASELQPKFLLIDEKKGRMVASKLGIPIIGLLGILLIAKEEGLIKELRPVLLNLKKINFFIAPKLANLLLHKEGEEPI